MDNVTFLSIPRLVEVLCGTQDRRSVPGVSERSCIAQRAGRGMTRPRAAGVLILESVAS